MSLLAYESSGPAPKGGKKNLKLVLGISALAGAITLGSTLAANINLNGGGNVEFGQGLVTATACDPDITLTPFSTFVNAPGGGAFMGTSIVISGVDSSTEGCADKNFTISSFSDTSPIPIAQIIVAVTSTSPWFTIPETIGVTLTDVSSSNFSITIDPAIIPIEVTEVSRFTVESKDSVDAAPVGYEVGDIGPGGGIVFYKDANGFNCGPLFSSTGSPNDGKCNYLEAAPTTGTNAWTDADFAWSGNTEDEVGTTSDAIGSGYFNSTQIVEQIPSGGIPDRAATISRAYRGPNDKRDWYLPSVNELYELWLQRTIVGAAGFTWWSSTESGLNYARCLFFENGFPPSLSKTQNATVRPIRAF
jgi:hypothetical protein